MRSIGPFQSGLILARKWLISRHSVKCTFIYLSAESYNTHFEYLCKENKKFIKRFGGENKIEDFNFDILKEDFSWSYGRKRPLELSKKKSSKISNGTKKEYSNDWSPIVLNKMTDNILKKLWLGISKSGLKIASLKAILKIRSF